MFARIPGIPSLIVVSGPTASGKTSFALNLAEKFHGEIVNADSVQLYQGFDIGSAKPSVEEFSRVPHHLFSIADPREQWNAGKYQRVADETITEIVSREKLPVVVGGSGLFIRALLSGLVSISEDETGGVLEARREIEGREAAARQDGESEEDIRRALHAWLSEMDSESAMRLHWNDISRVRRALVVKLASGIGLHARHAEHQGGAERYRALVIVLNPARKTLYEAIDRRVEQMFAHGLVNESRQLLEKYGPHAVPFGVLGYRHVLGYVTEAQKDSLEAIESLVKRDTRRFAKRQLTWWRHQPQRLRWKEAETVLPDLRNRLMNQSDASRVLVAALESAVERFLSRQGEYERDGVFVVSVNG